MLITYDYDSKNQLVKQSKIKKGMWLNAIDPTPEEIKEIQQKTNVPMDYIYYSLDRDESARTEYDEDYHTTLIIFDVPQIKRQKEHKFTYRTTPVGIIIKQDYLITISITRKPFLDSFSDNRRPLDIKNPNKASLQIISHVISNYQRYLKDMNRVREQVENRLQDSLQNDQLYSLMGVQRGLVYFLLSLRTDRNVLENLRRAPTFHLSEVNYDYLDDIIIENQQAVEMAQISNSIINETTDTYSSIINNNMNQVMKFLTTYSIILTIPTLVFSFYGMNVDLPLARSHASWIITIIISLVISLVLAFRFWQKRYFK
ncbi:magnesium transporter CorA family protein [Agrilactobacillus fermenti]|uniref:magnesium transporter CorA family protein n=1 Tax=Agrilactobacillus fermenti TaxID=2586909 RepID=UPI001E33E803|nr:magnesium transporter CorA family protein [Agrilactobacillus fermenti]MCD2257270.1 magnesium transporter CorA family protein [Agrilactobacillus fermenti]